MTQPLNSPPLAGLACPKLDMPPSALQSLVKTSRNRPESSEHDDASIKTPRASRNLHRSTATTTNMKYPSLAVIGALKAFNSGYFRDRDPAVKVGAAKDMKSQKWEFHRNGKSIVSVSPPYEKMPEEGLTCGSVFGPTPKSHFTKRSAFLQLPAEIRIKIYQEYFRGSKVWLVKRHSVDKLYLVDRNSFKNRRLPLLLVCRCTYLEGIDVLYSSTIFTLNESSTIQRLPMILPARYDCGYDSIRTISTMCLVSPEGIAAFEKACDLFASIPSLHSLRVEVSPVGKELDRRLKDLGMQPNWTEVVMELEQRIRAAICQLQQVKSICVWFQWGRVGPVGSLISLPKSCTVHRRYGQDATSWTSIDEDHAGQEVKTGTKSCHRCSFET